MTRVIRVDRVSVLTKEGYLLKYNVKFCPIEIKHWYLRKWIALSPFLGTIMIYFRLKRSLTVLLCGESQYISVLDRI